MEECPEVDEDDFPPKPEVGPRLEKAADFISAVNDKFGGNKRLEQAILDQV